MPPLGVDCPLDVPELTVEVETVFVMLARGFVGTVMTVPVGELMLVVLEDVTPAVTLLSVLRMKDCQGKAQQIVD